LLLSIPVGLIVTDILVINNLRDLPTDLAAGKRTLATRIGDRATRIQYVTFILAAHAIPVVIAIVHGVRRPLLVTLASVPFALRLSRMVLKGTSGRDLNPILGKTGKLLLFFGLLLSVGALISRPS
jgi:1,4-dihydroxy-2-naphthoate octaprenyltransferase